MANANPFAALDSDEEEVPVKVVAPSKKTKAPAPAPAPAPAKANSAPKKQQNSKPREGGGDGERPRRPRTDRPPRTANAANAGATAGEERAPTRERPERDERPERGERRYNNRQGGRGGEQRHDRTHDRHSGTNRGKFEPKKQGGGSHNWGTETDGVKAPEDADAAAAGAADGGEGGEGAEVVAEGVVAQEQAPEAEVEEPDNSMTLEEFQAKQRAEREAVADLFGSVNEKKVDASEFTGGRVFKKDENVPEDFLAPAGAGRNEPKKKAQRAHTKQAFVDVGFRAPAIERGERERGGRGRGNNRREGGDKRGGRGRGNRDGNRDGGNRDRVPMGGVDVNDEGAFPKL